MSISRFKFRAWNGKWMVGSEYGDWISFDGDPYTESPDKHDTPNIEIQKTGGYVLMQFTGLKDKNGKEIYANSDVIKHNEHKIIIIDSANMGLVGVVINRNFGSILSDGMVKRIHHRYDFNTLYNIPKYIEVIGDIYSNPELIKP